MKKIQMSLAALSVLAGAVGALAFKPAVKVKSTTREWFIYSSSAAQTKASFNTADNYVVGSDPGCNSTGALCAIQVTATSVHEALPVIPSGLGTSIASNLGSGNYTFTGGGADVPVQIKL